MRLVRRNHRRFYWAGALLIACAAAGFVFSVACGASTVAIASVTTGGGAFSDPRRLQAPAQGSTQAAVTQSVGTVKAIDGNVITLTPDSGGDITVAVTDTTKIVQVAPGQKDLKTAAAIQISDLQVGDRILVRSRASDDPKSITALGVIAMKRTDVDAKKTQDRDDWQKRGIGGLVKEVNPAGTITISAPAVAGVSKTVAIHTTKATILRRYAPDSVKFDEAKPAAIDQIKPGDQLRARGEKSANGDEFTAAEIVSGTFRNIAGTITVVDAAAKTISVSDLISKRAMVVKISDESQLKKLTPETALRIAMRLRGGGADAVGGGAGGASSSGSGSGQGSGQGSGAGGNGAPGASNAGARPNAAAAANGGGAPPAGGTQRSGFGGGGGGARPDFQQLVNRLPAATLTDFQKGDAVLVVSTQGTDTSVTAITLLGGVEAILAAAPGGAGQAMTLSPWSLGAAPGGDASGAIQ